MNKKRKISYEVTAPEFGPLGGMVRQGCLLDSKEEAVAKARKLGKKYYYVHVNKITTNINRVWTLDVDK